MNTSASTVSRSTAPRVLHLIETGGPGGAESVFATLIARQVAAGDTAIGAVPYDGWLAQNLRSRGREPIITPSSGAFDWRYLRRIAGLIRQHRIDVLCAHLFGAAVYGSALSSYLRMPLVSVLHGVSDFDRDQRFAGVKSWLVGRSDKIVFVSESLRATLVSRLRIPAQRTEVIYNGVDTTALTPQPNQELHERLNLPADSIVIGSVGNVRPAKGYDVLLDVARIVCEQDRRVHFVIAGQPQEPLQSALEKQRADYRLDERVHFVGMHNDIHEFMNGLDIYLLTSTSEGFSIACVEAMACGLPIVATRCGGPEEILAHDTTGLLVGNAQPAQISEALFKLIATPSLRSALATNARQHAISRFSVERMVDSYRTLFAQTTRAR